MEHGQHTLQLLQSVYCAIHEEVKHVVELTFRTPSPSPSLCGEAGLLHGLLSLPHSLHSFLLSGPAPAQSCLHGDQAVGQPVPVAAEEPLPAKREWGERGREIREGGEGEGDQSGGREGGKDQRGREIEQHSTISRMPTLLLSCPS